MPDYANFGGSTPLKIQLDQKLDSSRDYQADLGAALTRLVSDIAGQVQQLPADKQPTELQIEFGLRALGGGGYAIVNDPTLSNFRITATWGGDQGAALIANLPIP